MIRNQQLKNMKKYINKKFKISWIRLHILFFLFISCTIANGQEISVMTTSCASFSMTPQYSDKEIDSLKWNIVTMGDESSFFECQLALWSKSNGNASVMYTEFFPYTLIMAFVYEFPSACYYLYTILSDYHKERKEDLTEEELLLCIRSLSIGAQKGVSECEIMLEQLYAKLKNR